MAKFLNHDDYNKIYQLFANIFYKNTPILLVEYFWIRKCCEVIVYQRANVVQFMAPFLIAVPQCTMGKRGSK